MTRIFTDHERSLRWLQTNRHRDISSTSISISSNQQEYTDKNAEKHGTRPRMVWW